MPNKKLENLIKRAEEKTSYIDSIRQSDLGRLHRLILRTLSKGPNISVESLANELQLSPDLVARHLETLDENDIIRFKEGDLKSAYPFAAKVTRHQLTINGNTAYALCAIDALSIPFMLNIDIAIKSSCTFCEQPVTVEFSSLKPEARPADTALWIPLVKIRKACDDVCPHIDLFCCPEHALEWQDKTGYDGVVLNLKEATELGKYFFDDFLER